MTNTQKYQFLKKHLDKIGIGGSIFAALCCLGFPALLSILSAIGLGFFINDAILLPLLIISLIITVSGLALGMRHHHQPWALVISIISAAGLFLFIFVRYNMALAYISVIGLIAASILNVFLNRRISSVSNK